MSELRRNPVTGQWVILAENRADRPQEFVFQEIPLRDFQCPFCEGQEHRTPGETLAIRNAGSERDGLGWRVRVVPNKFPVLEAGVEGRSNAVFPPHPDPLPRGEGEVLPGIGLHEIVIESPRHLTTVTQLTAGELADVLSAYRRRLGELVREKTFAQATLFKNSGSMGGATLSHVHSQLVATGATSAILIDRGPAFQRYAAKHGQCPICQEALGVAEREGRVIAATQHFVAYSPLAPRFAYETWIVPREHRANFQEIDASWLPELAGLFRQTLVKLEAIVKLPAYNYIVHTAPFDSARANHYHWHIEILPRITNLAGFELGSGCFINAVYPEKAAATLRNLAV
jgi:UDPglucose--hexose-1-phosphate uridylyltransferase